MGSSYRKIAYEKEGAYGSVEHGFYIMQYNRGSDSLTVRDENGEVIFWSDEFTEKNRAAQLVKLLSSGDMEYGNNDPDVKEASWQEWEELVKKDLISRNISSKD